MDSGMKNCYSQLILPSLSIQLPSRNLFFNMKYPLYWILIFSFSTMAYAVDLLDVYQQSLENDPTFKQAYSTYLSSAEAIPQARAALYPQLKLGGIAGHNTLSVLGDFSGTGVLTNVSKPYNSTTFQLDASQAIF